MQQFVEKFSNKTQSSDSKRKSRQQRLDELREFVIHVNDVCDWILAVLVPWQIEPPTGIVALEKLLKKSLSSQPVETAQPKFDD